MEKDFLVKKATPRIYCETKQHNLQFHIQVGSKKMQPLEYIQNSGKHHKNVRYQ